MRQVVLLLLSTALPACSLSPSARAVLVADLFDFATRMVERIDKEDLDDAALEALLDGSPTYIANGVVEVIRFRRTLSDEDALAIRQRVEWIVSDVRDNLRVAIKPETKDQRKFAIMRIVLRLAAELADG